MSIFNGTRKIIIGGIHQADEFENCRHAFIVCDPFLKESNATTYLTEKLEELGVEYTVYSDVMPDPDIDLIIRGIESVAEVRPDVMVGFGGGSAIDACKAMMFFAKKKGIIDRCRLIAIPTTSGTGSEVTDFSVITDKEKSTKYPLVDPTLMPGVAVLDAELTLTVPKEITAATGMDALTHAIEAIVSKEAEDFSDAMAEKAIKLIRSNLLKVYGNPDDIEARQAMHNASCLAGAAFNNAGLGLNHGMAHALGANFHMPHGMANAVLLPYVMGYNAGCFDSLTECAGSYARIARLICVDSGSIRQSALNLIRSVKKFNGRLNMPSCIEEAGIKKEDFKAVLDDMAKAAAADRCTRTNPRSCTVDDIKKLYVHAYFGTTGRTL